MGNAMHRRTRSWVSFQFADQPRAINFTGDCSCVVISYLLGCIVPLWGNQPPGLDCGRPRALFVDGKGAETGGLLWCGWRRLVRLWLLGDDLILDLVVGRLRNDLFEHEITFGAIR